MNFKIDFVRGIAKVVEVKRANIVRDDLFGFKGVNSVCNNIPIDA